MRWLTRLLALALFVGALLIGWRFASENAGAVRVHFVIGEISDVALWKALLLAFAAGAVCAGLGWLRLAVKSGLMSRRYRKMLGDLESEIHQLRNLPLAPDPVTPSDVPARAADASQPREPLGRGA
jgi:hypothetical protein